MFLVNWKKKREKRENNNNNNNNFLYLSLLNCFEGKNKKNRTTVYNNKIKNFFFMIKKMRYFEIERKICKKTKDFTINCDVYVLSSHSAFFIVFFFLSLSQDLHEFSFIWKCVLNICIVYACMYVVTNLIRNITCAYIIRNNSHIWKFHCHMSIDLNF